MNTVTEKLFGTLEVLCDYSPVFWDRQTQENFDFWQLLRDEGFVKATDPELAFEHWQNMEDWGAPTELTDYEYAPLRAERNDSDWSESIASQRKSIYKQLKDLLINHCKQVKAYQISMPTPRQYEWDHPNFYISIVVAKTHDDQWICLAPRVPDQASFYRHDTALTTTIDTLAVTSSPIDKIHTLLGQLPTISLYGYYHGGYNYTYLHQVFSATAKYENQAITQALMNGKMIFHTDLRTTNPNSHTKFMQTALMGHRTFSVSFWDLGYHYEIARTPSGDWIGTRQLMEFEYNP
jgi:hypothetical protein